MSNRIVAWRVPDWHGDEWQELDEPLDDRKFESIVARQDDECAEEGVFCEGFVRLDDGRELPFHVGKSYFVHYSLEICDK